MFGPGVWIIQMNVLESAVLGYKVRNFNLLLCSSRPEQFNFSFYIFSVIYLVHFFASTMITYVCCLFQNDPDVFDPRLVQKPPPLVLFLVLYLTGISYITYIAIQSYISLLPHSETSKSVRYLDIIVPSLHCQLTFWVYVNFQCEQHKKFQHENMQKNTTKNTTISQEKKQHKIDKVKNKKVHWEKTSFK